MSRRPSLGASEAGGAAASSAPPRRGAIARAGAYLVPLVAGAIGVAVVLASLPDRGDDPFRTTLAILPLILGAALAIERFLRAQGLPRLRAPEATTLVGAVALLVAVARRAPSLGLAAVDPLAMVGFLLVLGYWVSRVLARLRPLLGARLPARPRAIFFWLPFLVYSSLIPWTTRHRPPDGDEPYNLLIAHSLVHDGDADLTNNYLRGDSKRFLDRAIEPQLGDPRGTQGQIYSRHNLLLPLLLAIPYGIAGRGGALFGMAALTALLAWIILRAGRHYFPARPGEVLAAWSVVCFLPPLLLYSSQIWVEVPAALLVVYGLDRIHAAAASGRARGAVLGLAATILLLPLLKIRLTLLAGSLLALFCWRAVLPVLRRPVSTPMGMPEKDSARPPFRVAGDRGAERVWAAFAAVALTAILALLAAGILLFNQARFGNPLKVHSLAELDLTTHPVERYLRGIGGLFFDGAFGLFASAPIWLIVLPALAALLGRRGGTDRAAADGRRLLVDAAFVAIPYLVFVAPRGEWYGGWSPPFRYGLAFLPLLGLALTPAFVERRRPASRVLIAALGAASLVLALLWVSAPGWTYNFANGTSRVLDHLGTHLGVDVARLAPSFVRPRAAVWWGPAAAVVIAVLWRLPQRRSVTAAGGRALGTVLLLAAASGALVAAARWPTRTVEVEDAYVEKSGGELNPPMWTIDRWRYRGAWLLPEGERMMAPVAAGGSRVVIEIESRYVRRRHPPLTLLFSAGDRPIGSHDFADESDWSTVRLGPYDWPAGAPLVVEATGPDLPADGLQRNRLVIDRLRLTWQ